MRFFCKNDRPYGLKCSREDSVERVAAFVDAGYFWVQLSYLLYGEKRKREDILIDAPQMRESLIAAIHDQFSDCSLLRIYWYDGRDPRGILTEQHQALARLDDIKMRYGTLNAYGQQKGVDGLLMADLLALAQNRAITSAIILSGDADLAPGVGAAQMLGVRIHRLGINGRSASSPILMAEVDKNVEWPREEIERFARKADFQNARIISMPGDYPATEEDDPAPLTDGENAPEPMTDAQRRLLELNATLFVSSLSEVEKEAVNQHRALPLELDKRLLYQAKMTLRHFLSSEEKTLLRALVQARLPLSGDARSGDAPAPFPMQFDSFSIEEQPDAAPRPEAAAQEADAESGPAPADAAAAQEGSRDRQLLLQCATRFVDSLPEEEKTQLRDSPRIPQERDRELLYQTRLMFQRHLWPEEKVILRAYVQSLLQGDAQDIESRLDQCAAAFVETLDDKERKDVRENYGIPAELDRRLLFLSRDTLHRPLFDNEKNQLRNLVRQRLAADENGQEQE